MPEAITIGMLDPNPTVQIVDIVSSEMPWASFPIVFDVQGAINIRSTLLSPPFAS